MVVGQLEDEMLLERVLGEYEIHTVFHIGAQAIVGIITQSLEPLRPISGTYNFGGGRGPWLKML